MNYKGYISFLFLLCTASSFAHESSNSENLEACLNKDGRSTNDILICYSNELESQEKQLKEKYKKALKHFSDLPRDSKAFKGVQKEWRIFIEKKCNFYAIVYEGGSLAYTAPIGCKIDEIKIRLNDLDEFARDN